MDIFFWVSKIAWLLLAPTNLLALAIAAGLALWRWRGTSVIGKRLTVGACLALLVIVVLPIGDWMVLSLERRFPAYRPCAGPDAPHIAGILLLGGGLAWVSADGQYHEHLNDAADRIRYAAELARQNPQAPVLVSGGQVFTRPGARSEAEGMADVLAEFGVERSRIRLEAGSRTTAENAALTRQLAGEAKGSWLLVTSGWHMPRSVGAFRKAGVPVIAAPTDWRIDDHLPVLQFSAAERLGKLDMAMREYLGLLAYRLAGRTDQLLPGPGKATICPGPSP